MADDHAAHRRRDHGIHGVANLGGKLGRERLRQPLGPLWIHQHAGALQIARAPEPGRQNEMPLEQRVGSAKFGQDLIVRHHLTQVPLG